MAKKKKVYGEGSITQRKDGRYQVSVPGLDGKRRYGYADSEKEAEKLRRQLLSEVEQGKTPPSKQPFQVHAKEWLEMRRRGGDYKPSTYIGTLSRMGAHFLPALGHLPLNKITPSHIQKLYNQLLDKGLSPNTIRKYHDTLKSCLDSAIKQGKLNTNPCGNVELPKKKKPKNGCLTAEEAIAIMEAVKDHPQLSTLVPLALATEARLGELLALSWRDVDFKLGLLHVSKTVTRVLQPDGSTMLDVVTPKSESGTRDITLPDFALEALRSRKIKQMKEVFLSQSDLVFPGQRHAYLWPSGVSEQFKAIAQKLGLDVCFHDLRHTGATLLLEADIPANVVQERLGHADVATTLRTYAHVTKRMKDQSTNTLQTLFSKKNADSEAI